MAGLSPEEQREYEEEVEYAREHGSYQERQPTATERIKGAILSGAGAVKSAANSQTMRDWAARSSDGGGLGGYEPPSAMRRAQPPRAGTEVNSGSIIHPGNRILVVEGSVPASTRDRSTPREKRRPSYIRGGLGDDDHGL